jgi:hypothetical protein
MARAQDVDGRPFRRPEAALKRTTAHPIRPKAIALRNESRYMGNKNIFLCKLFRQ